MREKPFPPQLLRGLLPFRAGTPLSAPFSSLQTPNTMMPFSSRLGSFFARYRNPYPSAWNCVNQKKATRALLLQSLVVSQFRCSHHTSPPPCPETESLRPFYQFHPLLGMRAPKAFLSGRRAFTSLDALCDFLGSQQEGTLTLERLALKKTKQAFSIHRNNLIRSIKWGGSVAIRPVMKAATPFTQSFTPVFDAP